MWSSVDGAVAAHSFLSFDICLVDCFRQFNKFNQNAPQKETIDTIECIQLNFRWKIEQQCEV